MRRFPIVGAAVARAAAHSSHMPSVADLLADTGQCTVVLLPAADRECFADDQRLSAKTASGPTDCGGLLESEVS